MKRIAIFCDGTWNRHDSANPTNVVTLAQAVKPSATDGRTQTVFYVMGVGTGRGSSRLARTLDKFAGGALGWGLNENIEDAFRSLIFCYELGDEIYIFGFSRGAYTARSLAGLIRASGIPPRENVDRIGEAMARYRCRTASTNPKSPESFEFRAKLSPLTATSDEEFEWRKSVTPGPCINLKIAYLGVWDTVGSLGVPGHWSVAPLVNKQYEFHDTDLSRMVVSARHAVAVDERRRTFEPTLWTNLPKLNYAALGLAEDAALADPVANWPYREEWFPGDHGSVGGGGDRQGLSSYAFDFIAQGAMKAGLDMHIGADPKPGLDLRSDVMERIAALRNNREELRNHSTESLLTTALRITARDRDGPQDDRLVNAVTKERIGLDPGYRPRTLRHVMDAIQRGLRPASPPR